ncbi:MAG: aminotransferase class V-fold PLP-dependent enzyme [Pseudonocardiaceae bacterium]
MTPTLWATRSPARTDEDHLATLRADLPAVTAGGYFNSGYTGPLCRAAHQAALATAEREYWIGRMGGHARTERERVHTEARAVAAGLLGAGPGEIALTHHTTDGMNLVAHGVAWRPGDNVVSTRVEHKGGILPLGVLRERHGVQVRAVAWSPGEPPGELPRRIAEAVDARTRLVVVSHASYVDGGVLDLVPVVTAAHRRGALVAVDGAQSAGVLPIDVAALDVDAYAISGQKWLCGPEGSGALYVHPRCLDRIGQTVVGWASVDAWELDGHFTPNPDATRYEVGTRNLAQIAGFAAAVDWLRTRVGLPWAAARTAALAEQAREQLCRVPGVTVLTPRRHTGLVTLRTPLPADELVRRMAARGCTVRSIQGYECVRASIGFFHTEEEVAALVEALSSSTRA